MVKRALLLVLACASTTVAADPTVVAITSTHQSHGAYPIVVAGPSGWLVVWEEQPPAGADRTRHVAAAMVDTTGKVVAGPKRLLDGGNMPNDLVGLWNGKAFTLAVCNGAWGADDGGKSAKLIWGEVAADLAFTRTGEQPFDAYSDSFSCWGAALAGGDVTIGATVREDSYGGEDGEERTGHECTTRRVTLGATAKLGKPVTLCSVSAMDDQWIVGEDLKDRVALADAKGKLHRPKGLDYRFVAAAGGGFVGLTFAKGADTAIELRPPYKKPSRTIALARGPIGTVQVGQVIALPAGGLGLVGATPTGIGVGLYRADGTLAWSGTFGGARAKYETCTPNAGAVLCVWADDDDRTYAGEIKSARIAIP